ncbi:response regulator [Pseudooceanicola nanhaiensis]|uniref:response regulator n=1 Tax=Pseudooceanicola nanhaiensis TaxID=375761 RepID=UPI001CD30AD5|nr:response regulator [Pseudooceanicola nanhaiensis]MCA0921860.1 response regulator [Pseudooceanicola nanhaiensis]
MDDLDTRASSPAPTGDRPLLGLTVLVVEDSRYASDAMRLLCLRSGARIRRADSLRAARRHLRVYRPSITIIDLGLPDGDGAELIADLARATPRVAVILATSGETQLRDEALAAGADGFLAKPMLSVMAFQDAILRHLPPEYHPRGPREVLSDRVEPDPIAYRDDMAHLAAILAPDVPVEVVDYARQFLQGVAQDAEDIVLLQAVKQLEETRRQGAAHAGDVARVTGLLRARLAQPMAI